jgi:hypothetical protein
MKYNVFVETESGAFRAIGLQEEFHTDQLLEDELINSIDEQEMSPEQILARRFLKFLGNRRLTMKKLLELPVDEQLRIKEEFTEV